VYYELLAPGNRMSILKLLFIEDNPADVTILRYSIECHGEECHIEVLPDGAAALQFVRDHRSGRRKPDMCVILLDLHIPKYDGLEILQAIAEAPVLAHIRVVVMSAVASPAEQQVIVELGAVFRKKPSSLDENIELGRELIAICKSSHAATA
jgi:CheY-like chemotaxis protein